VRFLVRDGDTLLVNGTAVVDPNQVVFKGWVTYEWQAGDTDTIGKFLAEWEVTWPSPPTGPATFPNDGYMKLVVKDDLG
jgi:hypothetical protein